MFNRLSLPRNAVALTFALLTISGSASSGVLSGIKKDLDAKGTSIWAGTSHIGGIYIKQAGTVADIASNTAKNNAKLIIDMTNNYASKTEAAANLVASAAEDVARAFESQVKGDLSKIKRPLQGFTNNSKHKNAFNILAKIVKDKNYHKVAETVLLIFSEVAKDSRFKKDLLDMIQFLRDRGFQSMTMAGSVTAGAAGEAYGVAINLTTIKTILETGSIKPDMSDFEASLEAMRERGVPKSVVDNLKKAANNAENDIPLMSTFYSYSHNNPDVGVSVSLGFSKDPHYGQGGQTIDVSIDGGMGTSVGVTVAVKSPLQDGLQSSDFNVTKLELDGFEVVFTPASGTKFTVAPGAAYTYASRLFGIRKDGKVVFYKE